MDSGCVYEQNTVVHELTQAIQMAKQLRANMDSAEAREFLIQKILSSYENALSVLKSGDSAGQPPTTAMPAPSLPDSSISIGSDEFEFDPPFPEQGQSVISKKRKEPITLEDQTKMCTDNGLEGNIDDGYSWRKYGQKHILGAKFPRSYYRCTYRKVQNCRATKQVQRTDENPKVFEIAYKGKHTCNHVSQLAAPPIPPSPEKYEIKPTHDQLSLPNPSEMLTDSRDNHSVNTGVTIPPPFSFPSTPLGFTENYQQLQIPNHIDAELLQVYSPPFISPATSESNYFPEWGSSPSLDFPTDPADVDPDFKFHNSFFY